MRKTLRVLTIALAMAALFTTTVFAGGGNDECKNENSNSLACRQAEQEETGGTTDTSTNNGNHTGWENQVGKEETPFEVVVTEAGTVVTNPAGTSITLPTSDTSTVTVSGSTTNSATSVITPNTAGKARCDEFTATGATPEAPADPMSYDEFVNAAPWQFDWKDQMTGRSRTWPTGACSWTGNHWSSINADPSNAHIGDADLTNDGTWAKKMRQRYEQYLLGEVVFP